MRDTKKKLIDVSVAVALVLIILVVLMPLYFPDSGINPFNLISTAADTDVASTTDTNKEKPIKAENSIKETKPTTIKEENRKKPDDPNVATDHKPLIKAITVGVAGVLVLASIFYLLFYQFRLKTYKTTAKEMIYFKVMPSSDYKIPNMAYAKYFLINLSKHLQSPWDPMYLSTPWCRVVYKKKMEDGNIEMIIGVPKDRTQGFINAFKAYYPRVQLIEYFEIYKDAEGNKYRITSPTELIEDTNYGVSEFKLKHRHGVESLSPIKMYTKKPDEMDTLETIIASMGAGEVESEEVIVDVTIRPVWSERYLYSKGKKAIDKIRGNKSEEDLSGILNGAADELLNTKSSKTPSKKYSSNEYTKSLLAAIKQKCSRPERAYSTNVRVYVKCNNPEHITMKLKSVVDGFETLAYSNEFETDNVYKKGSLWDRIYRGYPHPINGMILSTSELVSFVRVLDSESPLFSFTDHNDTMAIRAPSGFWEDETIDYLDMD